MTCSFSSHSVWSPGITPVFATDGSLGIEPWEHQSPGQIQDFSRIHQVRWSQGPMPKVISSSWRICCIRAPKQRMQRWTWHAWMPTRTRRGRNNLGCSPPCLYLEFALLQVANIKSECIWLMSGIQQWAMQSTHPVPRTKKTCPGARGTFYTGTTWRFADLDCSKTLFVRRERQICSHFHTFSSSLILIPHLVFSLIILTCLSRNGWGCRAITPWFARCNPQKDPVEGTSEIARKSGIVQEIVESAKSSHVFLISVSSRSFCQMSTPRFVFLALREQLQLPKIFLGSA